MVTAPAAPSFLASFGPVLIVLLFCAAIGIFFYASGRHAYAVTDPHTKAFKEKLDRAGISANAEHMGYAMFAGTVLLWAVAVVVLRLPLLMSFAALPLLLFIMFTAVGKWVNYKIAARQAQFTNQLEGVLRVMASGVRAGLTIRQALVLVTEEAAEPSRYEFKLMIVQTNVGVSMNDALDRLAQRMPSPEVEMFTRTVIMQGSTGGNLAKVLDQLCDTIKERRRIFRKVKTITSEARGSAWILGALPLLAFGMIMLTLPDFRGPALHTKIGLYILSGGMVLEVLCAFCLYKLTQFKV